MTGVYAPYIYAGGGHWYKHHVLLLDDTGNVVSIHPFQGETERTTAYTGIVLPAFQTENGSTIEAALLWLSTCLTAEIEATLPHLLETVLPEVVLIPGKAVRLWNLDGVDVTTFCLDADAVLRPIHP